ncbi:SNARE-binding exocyst subunit S6 [Rhizophlyctis rosea]|uniref:SNARE-binding exocyst subunit S6 n=1 Tax=Rhizophlyctis rosea TaxID=64517 RepID=A0AAD5X3A8_9FUNG|nr:SNARE-binding exocyst subunit S6 [Rhizophlyctis rosea]
MAAVSSPSIHPPTVNLGESLVAEATSAAVTRIADILRHPDDLTNKLPSIRKRFAIERASIEAQLKTSVESQLDDAQRGLDILGVAREETKKVKGNLEGIDTLCADAQNTIRNYARIKKISRTHQNFAATKAMVEQFQSLNNQVARIRNLLIEDQGALNVEDDAPADNLLLIHYQLQQLETFRNTTMARCTTTKDGIAPSADVLNTLNEYFKKVDQLGTDFDMYFWNIVRRTLKLIKAGHASTIVQMVKVIEMEERADELAAVQETVITPLGGGPQSNSEIIKEISHPRPIKSYRIKFFDVLRDAIGAEISALYEAKKDHLPTLLQTADTVIDNLIIVHDELIPRFPKRYNIFYFYVLEYHRAIYDMVNKIIASDMEAGEILLLIKWVRDYYSSMSSRLDVGEDLLEPRLLDNREDELQAEYVNLVRTKLSEWLSNILSTETFDFLNRSQQPETDGSGQYLLTGSIIVFQMFNQQVDVVSSSSRGALLYDVVTECCITLDEFHKAWLKVLDSEYTKFTEHSPDLAEGLPEYVVALANDCLRSTEFSEAISARIEPMLDDPYRAKATAKIKTAQEGFMKVSRRGYHILIDIVLADLKPAFALFYCPPWYDQDLMRLVIGTLDDYCEDFKFHMAEYLFNKFTADLLDKTALSCVDAFRNKSAKFRMPTAPERMRADLESLVDFFARLKSPKRAKAAFEVVERIIAVVESEAGMAFLDFYALWKAFPDVPLEFVEGVLSRRDDLEKGQVREIMETCRSKAKEEAGRVEGVGPTVFSKLGPHK